MKKCFKILALVALSFMSFSMHAQNLDAFKGEFTGVICDREATLILDPTANTVESSGLLYVDPTTKEIKVANEMDSIKCLGTLDYYDGGGFVTYNILMFDDGSDMEGGGPASFMMVNSWETDPEEGMIWVTIDSKDNGKSVVLSDTRDIDDPLIMNTKLKRK